MTPTVNTDNKIFSYAFIGVLLLIGAIVFTVANFSSIVMLRLSSSIILGMLAIPAVSLLYKAVKKDQHRLKQA